MTIYAMGKKCVVLGLAMCLLLSSLHEVSCQVEGSSDLSSDDQESFDDVDNSNQSGDLGDNDESSSMMDKVNRVVEAHFGDKKRADRSDGSFGELRDGFKFDSNGQRVLEESDPKLEGAESATEYVEESEISKEKSKVETRETKFGGDDITDDEDGKYQKYYTNKGEKQFTADKNSKFSSKSHKIISEESATEEYAEESEISKEKSKVETHETKFGEIPEIKAQDTKCLKEYGGDVGFGFCAPRIFPTLCYQNCRKDKGAKGGRCVWGEGGDNVKCLCDFCVNNSDKNSKFSSKSHKIISEESAAEYAEQSEISKEKSKVETRGAIFGVGFRREEYESKRSNGGSARIMESLGLGQSAGSWRCFNQDKNGIKEEEDASIVIPKYEIDQIIKEESISQGSESKTSSLVASLTKIVESHKNTKWTSQVEIGKKTRKSSETVRLETVEKLKASLKKYRSLSVRELVDHPQFEEILAMAARYEEVSLAKVSHMSRVSMYRSVIMEGRKAFERVQHAENRIRLHEEIVKEKQSNVDAEFASVKALAQRGDMLKVKIFAIKKLLLRLEAEKEEVDMNFQKAVGNLSRFLEEASEAEEEYHLVLRKWKEEKASAEFSQEAIQSAEVVWVQFLSTLKTTTTTNESISL